MINQKELQSVSTMGAFDRYRYFIKKIADSGMIWYLKDENDNLALSEIDNNILIPVWCAREFINSCLNGESKNYAPTYSILDEFQTKIIPIIREREYLIDVFPVNNKAGFVVTLDEFINDLNIELGNY